MFVFFVTEEMTMTKRRHLPLYALTLTGIVEVLGLHATQCCYNLGLVLEKMKTHILCSETFFPKIAPFMMWWSLRGHR